MADISLRDYLSKLDSLLSKGAPSEVIHHCRHILQYFPKNADTYRMLGRALFNANSWQEAGEVFRRVLSVYPDDYTAHAGLSEVYLRLKRPDDAIWHLERAFEQDPNNQPVLDTLRELYRKHRKIEHAKVQLTAGAVARQYLRNSLYEQAIDTLQQALRRSPERVDLRLLLATTLHEAGHRVEAAEVALEVLNVLPDCLVANRILTDLWLSEQRPSDAQRYLNRIQSVDPYLALELAQGQAVPHDAFKLEELDYRRTAERELLTQAPDWLRDVDQPIEQPAPNSETVDDSTAWLGSFAPNRPGEDEELPSFDESFSTDLPDDWLADIPESTLPPINAAPGTPTPTSGMVARFNQANQPTPEAIPEPDFESLFSESSDNVLPVEDELADEAMPDLSDFFPEETAPPAITPPASGALTDSDPLAWLHESGIEIVDSADISDDLFDADDDNVVLQDADAADPLAWLQGYGDEYINEAATQSPTFTPIEDISGADDNPLAWLQANDIVPSPTHEAVPDSDLEEADPLDWLADESLLDEALSLEALTDFPDVSSPPKSQDSSPIERQNTMSNDDLDWLSSEDEPEDDSLPDWLTGDSASPSAPEPQTEISDWFADMSPAEESEVPDWLNTIPSEQLSAQNEPDADMTDWLSNTENLPEEEAVATDVPDWLSEMAPTAETSASDVPSDEGEAGFEWMSTEAEIPSPAETGVENMPDWLSAMQPDDEPVDDLQPEQDVPDWLSEMPSAPETSNEIASTQENGDGFEWMSTEAEIPSPAETGVENMPDWLSAMQPDDEPVADFQPDQDVPNWSPLESEISAEALSEMSEAEWIEESESPEFTPPEQETFDDQPAWMSSVPDTSELPFEDAPIAETPDWLQDAALAPGEMESPQADDGGFEWMSSEETISPAESGIEHMPDWLNSVPASGQPAPDFDPGLSDTPDWLADEPISGEIDQDFNAVIENDTPDWLSSMGEPADDEPEAIMNSDAPEWLNEARAADISEPTDGGGFEWMSSSEETISPAETGVENMPDWLNEIKPDGEPVAEINTYTSEPDWLNAVQEADEQSAQTDLEWVDTSGSGDTGVEAMPDWTDQPANIGQTATLDEGMYAWDDELEEAEPAQDLPDWVNNIQSQQFETDVETGDEAKGGEFSWIDDMNAPADDPVLDNVEESETVFASTANDFDFDAVPELEPEDVDTLTEETEVSNAPDWLNAMVPGLDVDYDALEDEPIEQSFVEEPLTPASARAEQIAPVRNQREFDWLVNMVDEETNQMAAIPDTGRRRRFIFSKQPVWLRQPSEKRDTAPASQSTADDDFDFDDVDLPPWLQ